MEQLLPRWLSYWASTKKQGQRKLRQLKILMGKEDHQYVTFKEFAEYSDIPLDELWDACQLP